MMATDVKKTLAGKDARLFGWEQAGNIIVPTRTAMQANTLPGGAGSGIISATGVVYVTNVQTAGNIVMTRILMDLTGLNSSAAGDIIGDDGAANCHIGQMRQTIGGITVVGTPFAGTVTCLETPAGGEPDIDLYSAVEGTGAEDSAITALDETALLNAGADWTAATTMALTAVPAADEYLYLVGSGTGTDATYTAGKFLIEIMGYAENLA